jgi:hypothetical protein
MRQSLPTPVLFFAPAQEEVDAFCKCLNMEVLYYYQPKENGLKAVKEDYRPVQSELRRLTEAWFDSGPNVRKLFYNDPVLARAAARIDARLIATSNGHAQLIYTNPKNMSPREPYGRALGMFFSFLLNPLNEKLSRPCKGCGNYYVKNTKRQIAYCSPICGRRHTSRETNRAQAQQKRNESLGCARDASKEWDKGNKRITWEKYVCKNAFVTKNFLTRTLATGEILPPPNANLATKVTKKR